MKKIAKKIGGDRTKKEKNPSDNLIIREIDNLARITASGFNDVNKKFVDVYKRFDDVDKRFDEMDRKFGDVYKRFDDVDKRFDDVDGRFNEVNERLGKIEGALFWEYRNRIDRLEIQVKELQSDYRELAGAKK